VKKRLCLIFLATSLTLGCVRPAHFYPVQGPLSSQTPLPVATAKISYGRNLKQLSMVLSSGEVCKGVWKEVPRGQTPERSDSQELGLQPEWDAVYGSGFYVAHVLGARYYDRATATCNQGTVLNVEIYHPEDTKAQDPIASVKGVAKDNHGNVYKLVME
jgi:hypothetical protein